MAGEYLPGLVELRNLALHLGMRPNTLVDAAMDDMAGHNDDKPAAPPKTESRTSPLKAANKW
ncbi:hypothetical protein LUCX_220 [Xanthomonas phage vB_XciM_LucasX]|nr:hypothetical protein LUCX_220 [Xanthomonas phage vB_XciM_LucasX]